MARTYCTHFILLYSSSFIGINASLSVTSRSILEFSKWNLFRLKRKENKLSVIFYVLWTRKHEDKILLEILKFVVFTVIIFLISNYNTNISSFCWFGNFFILVKTKKKNVEMCRIILLFYSTRKIFVWPKKRSTYLPMFSHMNVTEFNYYWG